MKGSLVRRALVAVGVSGLALLSVSAPAQATEATSATAAFVGDAGDYITGGGSYGYDVAAGDRIHVSADAERNHIAISIDGANGDWWYVDFAAPAGQELTAGTYTGAERYPFHSQGKPGLSYDGNGRGCNQLGGTFVVQTVVFGPHGYLERLDATFEQHCEYMTPAARGEIHIVNPPAPAELSLDLAVSTNGTASALNGKATVGGTVSCNVPVPVTITGRVTQVKNNVLIRGDYATRVDCTPGAGTPWTATADPTGTTPFQRGTVEVTTRGSAQDPTYGAYVVVDKTTVVDLDRVRS